MKKLNIILKTFFHHAKGGAVAIIFGLTLPVLIASVGVSVDMAQAYLVKTRLNSALDAAALAAAASGLEDANDIQARAEAFVAANYPPDKIGATIDVTATLDGDMLNVSASAQLDTSFMRYFGYDDVIVESQTTVQREVRGLEVVMVLDNTGSMATNDNIGTLRDAATQFIEILFENVSNPDYVKIGLVPYSNAVNVGPYGLGKNIYGDDYGDEFVTRPNPDIYEDYNFSNNPYAGADYGIASEDLIYDPTQKAQWHGCVLAMDNPLDIEDHSGPWPMYRFDFHGNNYYKNNYYYNHMTNSNDRLANAYNAYYGPNLYCPNQPIVPLISDEAFLLDAVDNMTADGSTLGNVGLTWGWRVISPEWPFDEGESYSDTMWDKVVLMMTDGINVVSNIYSAYGLSNEHDLTANDMDDRFLDICAAMKTKEIIIYTVTFDASNDGSGVDDDTKVMFQQCASSASNYHDISTQGGLEEVFQDIARELSNLHITQ